MIILPPILRFIKPLNTGKRIDTISIDSSLINSNMRDVELLMIKLHEAECDNLILKNKLKAYLSKK